MNFLHDLSQYTLLQNAFLAGLLAAVACGIIGSMTVVRRSTYVAGAIAHCVLAGMGAARYVNVVHGLAWMTPLLGATLAAIIAAVIIALVTLSGRQRTDTVLSALWAVGMAVGILFIAATPGYESNLMSYLFGSILMIGRSEVWHMLALDAVVVGLTLLFYDRFLIISFQPELARLRGVRVWLYHSLLLLLTALTVVLLTRVVGLILVIALLTLPAAIAARFTGRLWVMMLIATGLCLVVTGGGLVASYEYDLKTGPTIILLAGAGYVLTCLGGGLVRRLRRTRH